MQTYVAGFFFWGEQVALVCKEQPEWQKGLLNAIGGKIEANETSRFAMRREFKEETEIDNIGWHHLATERGPGYCVDFFHHHLDSAVQPRPELPKINDAGEVLDWYDAPTLLVQSLAGNRLMIGNLNWLLPMALDWRLISAVSVTAQYISDRPSW